MRIWGFEDFEDLGGSKFKTWWNEVNIINYTMLVINFTMLLTNFTMFWSQFHHVLNFDPWTTEPHAPMYTLTPEPQNHRTTWHHCTGFKPSFLHYSQLAIVRTKLLSKSPACRNCSRCSSDSCCTASNCCCSRSWRSSCSASQIKV